VAREVRGHRQLDHTADLALEIWAATESDLLVEAARALVQVMTEGGRPSPTAIVSLELDALDREDRLVHWLNEIVVRAVRDGFLMADADVTLDAVTGLAARVRGQPDAFHLVRTELKGVTYHDLLLENDDRGWRAKIVVDV
jgi:SHS2 domain-containing protein